MGIYIYIASILLVIFVIGNMIREIIKERRDAKKLASSMLKGGRDYYDGMP